VTSFSSSMIQRKRIPPNSLPKFLSHHFTCSCWLQRYLRYSEFPADNPSTLPKLSTCSSSKPIPLRHSSTQLLHPTPPPDSSTRLLKPTPQTDSSIQSDSSTRFLHPTPQTDSSNRLLYPTPPKLRKKKKKKKKRNTRTHGARFRTHARRRR